MSPERKLFLLPVDGSDQSMEVVRYVSRAVNRSGIEVVLLSVIDKSSDIFWDTGEDPKANKHVEYMQSWEEHRQKKMSGFMEAACQFLEQAGIPKTAITCNVQSKKEGIARDILSECRYGYNAVAIGRRGLGEMDESMLGSIAAKVFINVVEAPVCILGGKPEPGKIMIGLDNSLSAIRAINFVSRMLNPADRVSLVHISRIPEGVDKKSIREMLDEEEFRMGPVFETAARILTEAGFSPAKISSKVIQGSGSRAVNLYGEAKKEGFGTLVVGRRGIKDVQEFTLGRIAYKLGYISRDLALWLVP